MNRVLQMAALLAALALPAFCQNGRLSSDDQQQFDKAYTKWVNDTRKNDRDDIAKDVRKMQEIMARNNIPANVPYDQIASSGRGYQQQSYRGQLSPDDQKEFDKYYTKWVNDTRKNDRDDVDRDVRKMQEVMARNNIPADVPFDQVASTGYGPSYSNGYSQNAPYPANQNARLSPEDQRDFDRYYSQWLDDTRRNDREDANRDVQHMQDIMARNNIPSTIPFDRIATSPNGYSGYNNGYNNNGDNNAYPNANAPYGNAQNRLSPDDQREFDKAYAKWMKDSAKNDRDDIDKDQRKMQDIMSRYNIPTDVPYDQIASPNAAYQH